MDIETIQVVLQALTLFTLLIGLYLTIRQLQLLRRSYIDQHDWNRRKAAQDAIERTETIAAADTRLLDDTFEIMSKNYTIALDRIEATIKDNPGIKEAIHKRLNTFEGMAVGVHQGVFDEEVIKAACMQVLTRTLNIFREYINYRRRHGATDAWMDFQELTEEWEKTTSRRREQIASKP